jgi:hypothetical protein
MRRACTPKSLAGPAHSKRQPVEIRFFMPVQRAVPSHLRGQPAARGVLNTLLPAKAFTFKFAVGSTF